MAEIVSPSHKLGQKIGDFLQEYFATDIKKLCKSLGYYFDQQGPRRGVRGDKRKVTWVDNRGSSHDMDYVIEKGGTKSKKGEPLAFIEVAWRRYTKHSRNKAGELEGSMLALRDTYRSCMFLGAIIAGEFTESAIQQLESNGVKVLFIPFKIVSDAFRNIGINIDYSEKDPEEVIRGIMDQVSSLSKDNFRKIGKMIKSSVQTAYYDFVSSLRSALTRKVTNIVIWTLFGEKVEYDNIGVAINHLVETSNFSVDVTKPVKYETIIRFDNGSKIEASFTRRDEIIQFLRSYEN